MPFIAKFIIGLEIILFLGALGLIVYLIFRRIEVRKREDFEKRDN